MKEAFVKAGYGEELARVTLSNRPDLCEYQCNGAMAGAKKYKKAPIMIAEDVVANLAESQCFAQAEAVKPGFINLKLKPEFVAEYLNEMAADENLGVEKEAEPKTVMIDYGGPNVAKPLHVGHLRSAIIGESIKRIIRYKGNKVTGDIHLGDWGYQMGLIITELKKRQPDLPYFDESFGGEYPEEAPFTISELEEIYPTASAYAKEHEDYREEALHATYLLQNGYKGYRAIWKHIMNVSVTDLKKNYERLNVEFDLWKGEADAQKYIPGMVEMLKEKGFAHYDQGALVVDVAEETDNKEVPPCMILKSDGAALYDTTDLATLVEREELYQPDEVIYVVDKRQELHFIQVFRCAKKTGIVRPETELKFLGFGTMNGKDGKPFKVKSVRDAKAHGLALLTEERRQSGVFGILSIEDNTVIAAQRNFAKHGVLQEGKRFKAAKESNESMRTKTPSMKELMQNLSGGNQQKVLIARWLLTHPDILILDEPTRGIDVGAKYEIYTIMHDLIKEGKSIIMISSEMPELLGMADRVMVMCEGRVTGFLDREEADSVSVMRLATKFM